MESSRGHFVWLAGLIAFGTLAPAAAGAIPREPTLTERAAITAALPSSIRGYPVGCVWLSIAVSRSGRFAKVVPDVLRATRPPCLKYAGDGFYILKRVTRWRVIFAGSVGPPCALRMPTEILGRLRCTR